MISKGMTMHILNPTKKEKCCQGINLEKEQSGGSFLLGRVRSAMDAVIYLHNSSIKSKHFKLTVIVSDVNIKLALSMEIKYWRLSKLVAVRWLL